MIPKVSVIVPVYNTDRYLKSCLDSLVNQTLDDLEIIVVDDCSTDQSVLILEEYQKKYPMKMRIFRNPENKGQGYARNVGIIVGDGELKESLKNLVSEYKLEKKRDEKK